MPTTPDMRTRTPQATRPNRPERAGAAKPLSTAPPSDRPRVSAAETIYAALVGFVVAALLGSGSLVGLAERQPFGTTRDVALATAKGVDRVANLLSLNRPADIANGLLGRDRETYDLVTLAAEGGPAASPTPTSVAASAEAATVDENTTITAAAPAATADDASVSIPPVSTDPATTDVVVTTSVVADAQSPSTTVPETELSIPPSTIAAPSATVAVPSVAGRRAITAAAPLRLWIGGDSMVRELGDGVINAVDPTLVRPEVHFRVSSGLTRPDFYDWPQRIAQAVVEEQPDAFMIMFGANDNQNLETDAGVIERGTPEWSAEYGRRVGLVMDLLNRPGVTTVWVGQPIMRSPNFTAAMERMNGIYRAQAATRENVTFLDTSRLLADAGGAYAKFLPDASGSEVLMRQDDGVHLSRQGAERMAESVWAAVAAQWGISR